MTRVRVKEQPPDRDQWPRSRTGGPRQSCFVGRDDHPCRGGISPPVLTGIAAQPLVEHLLAAVEPFAVVSPRVGVAMAEAGGDETVTLLLARNDRPERPSIGRLCLCTAPRIATMSLVAG